MYSLKDPDYNREPEETYARDLRRRLFRAVSPSPTDQSPQNTQAESEDTPHESTTTPNSTVDTLDVLRLRAIEAVRDSTEYSKLQDSEGVPWGALNAVVRECLPDDLDGLNDLAYRLVPKVLESLLGPQDQSWESYKPDGRTTTWVRRIIDT